MQSGFHKPETKLHSEGANSLLARPASRHLSHVRDTSTVSAITYSSTLRCCIRSGWILFFYIFFQNYFCLPLPAIAATDSFKNRVCLVAQGSPRRLAGSAAPGSKEARGPAETAWQ